MTEYTFYMSWHTWRPDQVETPWDFWYLSKGTKTKSMSEPSMDLIQSVWNAQDTNSWDQLQGSQMWDVKLAAFVTAASESLAQAQVLKYFSDAEFHHCAPVDDVTKQKILKLFSDTLSQTDQA